MVTDDNTIIVPSSSMATAPTFNNSRTTISDETTDKDGENQTTAANAAPEISPSGKSTTSPIQGTQVQNVQMDICDPAMIVEGPEDDSITEDLPSNDYDGDKAIEDIIQPKSSRGRNVKPSLKAKEMQRTPTKRRRGKGRGRGRSHR